MTLANKLTVIFILGLVLMGAIVTYIAHESYLDDHQVISVGKVARVKYGYYENCKGQITKEVYSSPVTDQFGEFHPPIFAGYRVDLTCHGKYVGEREFTQEFLRIIK